MKTKKVLDLIGKIIIKNHRQIKIIIKKHP